MNRKMKAEMVNRFLGWKLPKDFSPDNHISFTPSELQSIKDMGWPVGTNLFTADQAREMVEYITQTVSITDVQSIILQIIKRMENNVYPPILGSFAAELRAAILSKDGSE